VILEELLERAAAHAQTLRDLLQGEEFWRHPMSTALRAQPAAAAANRAIARSGLVEIERPTALPQESKAQPEGPKAQMPRGLNAGATKAQKPRGLNSKRHEGADATRAKSKGHEGQPRRARI
jgi:hypothetical protein